MSQIDMLSVKTDNLQKETNQEKFNKVQIQTLQDEIAYLKRCHVDEQSQLKNENKYLRRSLKQDVR